jgi:predicted nucleic acid-binding Zn ribbon protein
MIKTEFFSQQLMADFDKLNIFHVAEVLEVVIYSELENLKDPKLETIMSIDLQGPSFPLDLQSKVFWAVRSKDAWKLKQLLKPFTNIIRNHKDACFEPLTLDMHKLFHRLIQNSIVDTQSGDGKRWFKMTQPGECTIFPYMHCRWCGLITEEKFRLCSMCNEYLDYPDETFFCSEQCENEALDKLHREEHARFFMLQLNMD